MFSDLVRMECLVGPLRAADQIRLLAFRSFFTDRSVVPLHPEVRRRLDRQVSGRDNKAPIPVWSPAMPAPGSGPAFPSLTLESAGAKASHELPSRCPAIRRLHYPKRL